MQDSNCPVTPSDTRRQSVTIGFSADLSHPLRVRGAGFEWKLSWNQGYPRDKLKVGDCTVTMDGFSGDGVGRLQVAC